MDTIKLQRDLIIYPLMMDFIQTFSFDLMEIFSDVKAIPYHIENQSDFCPCKEFYNETGIDVDKLEKFEIIEQVRGKDAEGIVEKLENNVRDAFDKLKKNGCKDIIFIVRPEVCCYTDEDENVVKFYCRYCIPAMVLSNKLTSEVLP